MAHVLIIDDDDGIREVLRQVFRDQGDTVSEAADGRLGLEILRASSDRLVVILDDEMPEMKGSQLLHVAGHDQFLATHHAYVLSSGTGSAQYEDLRSSLPFEVPLVPKPFDLDDLLENVRRADARLNVLVSPELPAQEPSVAETGVPRAWRTSREISPERQQFLAGRRAIVANVSRDIYPFKDIEPRLSRADIEWLLATHESQGRRGPVDWAGSVQESRQGVDLRGANLSKLGLHGLPLVCMRGALDLEDWHKYPDARQSAMVDLTGTNLRDALLQGANLRGIDLTHAQLTGARLDGAVLTEARLLNGQDVHLEGANLLSSRLEGANLRGAHLAGAALDDAYAEHAFFVGADLTHCSCFGIHGQSADFRNAHAEGVYFGNGSLERALLQGASLRDSVLTDARLDKADLRAAQLDGAALDGAHLEGADLRGALLARADLRRANFDTQTLLDAVAVSDTKHIGPRLENVRWGGANLTVVNWETPMILADEYVARGRTHPTGREKVDAERIKEYRAAVRANRQTAIALQQQGLNEEADWFAHRARVLQRHVLLKQGHWLSAFGAWLLDRLAGYGYKPARAFVAYVIVILVFASLFFVNAQFAAPHLTWDESLVLSISSFHGRGFFTSGISLGDTLARLAAGEAVIGLLIEITFIATFTQRFFAR
jgi:uncharacterized protein YjbI with pentapeptide repeats/DNA-binding response OmpR family regulator